ncbi:tripartite motif-containing protein 16-like [Erpetoichthys calabaricus]|uniref:Tripartite motif-containing protein 16-like n=1 Tax=Erpetoichthys calabaricus TaxID=27687 RepID=A0A8C4SLR4_ERPCA|nr:tripartite motif-containing protein 16-like [Erpetoichthys calabaricus]
MPSGASFTFTFHLSDLTMASGGWCDDRVICAVCLDMLKDPVTIGCGHNYCKECIQTFWDRPQQAGAYSCPQCRQTFALRPTLCSNTLLAEMLETLRQTSLDNDTLPPESCAQADDVLCDFCPDVKRKAVKSCLICLASYCERHVRSHEEAPLLRNHKLVSPLAQLDQKICQEHQRALELFCRTDQKCICVLCPDETHKGHNTVSVEAEWAEKQKQMKTTLEKIKQQMEERQEVQEKLKQTVQHVKNSTQDEIKACEESFKQVIQSIEKMRDDVIQLMRTQEMSRVSQLESLIKQLEEELEELKEKMTDVTELSNSEDHLHFLQKFHVASVPPEMREMPSVPSNTDLPLKAVRKAVADFSKCLQEISDKELGKINKIRWEVESIALLEEDPRVDNKFLKYICCLTLDPITAHRNLILSEDLRSVRVSRQAHPYPSQPQRFDRYQQVLCQEGLFLDRYYWEVEWNNGRVGIGVAYKGIGRKGGKDPCGLGYNGASWCLEWSGSNCFAHHGQQHIPVTSPLFPRIGVYLDFPEGSISFYGVSNTMTLLHRFQAKFTEPLYPGFWLYVYDCMVRICQPRGDLPALS